MRAGQRRPSFSVTTNVTTARRHDGFKKRNPEDIGMVPFSEKASLAQAEQSRCDRIDLVFKGWIGEHPSEEE